MTDATSGKKLLPRWFAVLMLATHLTWFWVAPAIQERMGHPDEAAWVGMYLVPSGCVGFVLGLFFIAKPTRYTASWFLLVFAVHLAIGFGYHPH